MTHALEQLRRAAENLARLDESRTDAAGGDVEALEHIGVVADWLTTGQPGVVSAVVTGTVEDVDAFVQASGADAALQLGARLYNGDGQGC